MSEYKFKQLVDLDQVHHLLESHHRLYDMAYSLFSPADDCLVAAGWQDILVQSHWVNPGSSARRRKRNDYIKEHLHEFEENLFESRSKNGMIEVAMPITIEGQHLATFVAGQFFYKDVRPDTGFFVQQAADRGVDRETYLKALLQVPICTREQVRDNVLFLGGMVKALSWGGLNHLKFNREMKERKRSEALLQKRAQIAINSFTCN